MGIVGKSAHVNVIYSSDMGELYTILAWAIVYYPFKAVESLTIVIFSSSHVFYVSIQVIL